MSASGSDSAPPAGSAEVAGRARYWDLVRGIGILLVVYGHVARGLMSAGILTASPPWTTLDGFIYSFHMPLFFFISGRFFPATFARQGPSSLLRRKLATVAYPYLLWSVIQGGIEIALAGLTNHANKPNLARILLAPIDQFWFLYALFLIFVVATAVQTAFRGRTAALVALSSALFFTDFPPGLWQGVGYVSYYLVFFALGALSAPEWSRRAQWTAPATALASTVFLTALIVLFATVAAQGSLPFLGARRILALSCALAGCGLVLCVAHLVRGLGGSVLERLGQRSMEIYLLHIIAASGARIVASRFLGMQAPVIHLALGMAAGILVPLIVSRWIRALGAHWLLEWPLAAGPRGARGVGRAS
jgi:fucose 4-O-acetylase-like acetyltransferase